MITLEFKAYGKKQQYLAIDEAIRTTRFIRNSCIRYWMDNKKLTDMTSRNIAKYYLIGFPLLRN